MAGRLCDVSWCLAVVEKPGVRLCAIHQRFGQDFRALDESEPCDTCQGSRECDECNGTGDCECRCGTAHDCGFCEGTGHCPDCHERAAPKLTTGEQQYVEWALSAGLRPCPPFFSGLTERA